MSTEIEGIAGDIAASRARLNGTLNRLQSRLNPSGIVEDMLGVAKRSDAGSATYDGILHAVRHNPLPVLLIAAGAVLLMRQAAKSTVPAYPGERDPEIIRYARIADRSTGDTP